MGPLRRILTQRLATGALGVVLAYMLLLQSVFASISQGMMAGAAPDPIGVICSIHGPSIAPDDPADRSRDCPCATLCQLGSSAAPALPATLVLLPLQWADEGAIAYAAPVQTPVSAPVRRLAHARAPPFLSA
jgi:hypothetical protein